MSEVRVKTVYNGKPAEGIEVPISQSNERWNEYKLEDGTMLRLKFTVASIIRVIGENDTEGNPVYMVRGTVATVPVAPEEKK